MSTMDNLQQLFNRYPLILPCMGMIGGIVLQHLCYIPLGFLLLELIVVLSIYLYESIRARKIPGTRLPILRRLSLWILLLFVASGQLLLLIAQLKYANDRPQKTLFLVEIEEYPTLQKRNYRYEARLVASFDSLKLIARQEKIRLYLDSSLHQSPQPGDRYWVRGTLRLPVFQSDSLQFNYDLFRRTLGIRYLLFVKRETQLKQASSGASLSWQARSSLARNRINDRLKHLLKTPEAYGLASGILLGDKSDLSPKSIEGFRKSGLTHALSVSGLHVGLISMLLYLLLFFLRRNSHLFFLKPLLVILATWSYIYLIGLPPAAVRAGVMITIVLIGELTDRIGYGINSLFAAAILLLAFNPYLLFSASFQLSFSATGAILIVMPWVNLKIRSVRSRGATYVIELIAVSIAAQLGTLPLTLYYFRTFPTYFLLANIVALPLITLLTGGTALVVALDLCGCPVPEVITGLLDAAFLFLSDFSSWVGNLPGSQWILPDER